MDPLSLDDDDDSDRPNSLPLGNQLKLCNDMMAEDTSPQSLKGEISMNGMDEDVSKDSAQEDALAFLGVSVYDHTQLEQDVMEQVDKALKEQAEKKRVEDASKELRAVEEDIRFVRQRLGQIEKAVSLAPKDPSLMTGAAKRELSAIKMEKENKLKHLKKIEAKRKALQVCITGSTDEVSSSLHAQGTANGEEDLDEDTLFHLRQVFTPKETEEERLIRLGEMTPFGSIQPSRSISIPQEMTEFDKFLITEAEEHAKKKVKSAKSPISKTTSSNNKVVVKNDALSGFRFTEVRAAPSKKSRSKGQQLLRIQKGVIEALPQKKKSKNRQLVQNYQSDSELSNNCSEEEGERVYSDEDVYLPDRETTDEEEFEDTTKARGSRKKKSKDSGVSLLEKNKPGTSKKGKMNKLVDDGDHESYVKRIKAYEMEELRRKHQRIVESEDGIVDSDEDDATEFEEGYKIPNSIWNKLYKYQQTCVRWLWELHRQSCGGILGDEMGLGKTIQVIAFLVGLCTSKVMTEGDTFRGLGPVLLVCPTTVMHQWVKEFHTWWPPFRVAILHDSGSFSGNKSRLIKNVNGHRGVLVTSYAGVVRHQDSLLGHEWHYVILDEGHKIRNPDAQATVAAKRFRTCHRLILSGSPVQNNLRELWSLFDFVFPGKLGTLPVFMQQFSVPIVQGGYANASQVQVQTAYKCATVLRDAIKPYLLRRMKSDVKMNINLPNKTEQVLFCQLTEEQTNLYKAYINSKEVSSILNAKLQIFVGLVNLRKICNHPDLFDGGPKVVFKGVEQAGELAEEEKFGFPGRSGKMVVVESLLRLWHKQGHRVLLFTQGRQMMDILELFVKNKEYTYMKMDGTTPISSRQPAINKFNSDPSIFVFLLTTRVGGLGVNLTGADRVLLYDPDWNPSTDSQARERAWRIGQKRQVTVYRLLTAGTIEEKIYHRQIFKQFVTNRVLKDPRQRRFFKSNDLYELFTYSELGKEGTETSAIFAGTGSEIRPKKNAQKVRAKEPNDEESKSKETTIENGQVSFSNEKMEQMKLLAKKLSMELTSKIGVNSDLTKKSIGTNNKIADQAKSKYEKPNEATAPRDSKSKNKKEKVMNERIPKRHRSKKAARVEGEKIEGVVKKSVFKPPLDEEERSQKEDDYVLSKLFKTSGVHTALRHDVIVDSSAPDYAIVEGEAQRVANEAVKALKESRRQCREARAGVPTWTGTKPTSRPRFGQKKRLPPGCIDFEAETDPSPSKKKSKLDGSSDQSGACSSSELLAAIKRRKVVFGTDKDQTAATQTASTEHDALLADILSFVAFQASVDGRATTREILSKFRDQVPPEKSAIFKALLKKICTFSRSAVKGEGEWRLKEEFR